MEVEDSKQEEIQPLETKDYYQCFVRVRPKGSTHGSFGEWMTTGALAFSEEQASVNFKDSIEFWGKEWDYETKVLKFKLPI